MIGLVAQRITRLPTEQKIAGSNPVQFMNFCTILQLMHYYEKSLFSCYLFKASYFDLQPILHAISIKIKNYLTKGSFLDVLTHTTAWIQVEKRQCRASQLSHAFHDHLLPGPGITRFKVSHYLFKFIRQSRKRLHKARSISSKQHAIWTGRSLGILQLPFHGLCGSSHGTTTYIPANQKTSGFHSRSL